MIAVLHPDRYLALLPPLLLDPGMESNPCTEPKHSDVQAARRTATAPPTGALATRTTSMFTNAQISSITGGSFRINNINIFSGPSLDALHKRVAPNAILNSGGRAGEVGCHPGTRKEVIDLIETWRDAQESLTPIFWVSGPAGTGKTPIVQAIAERCKADGVPHANFFSPEWTPRGTIILLYPSLRDYVAAVLSTNPLILDSALEDQLMQLIVAPLQAIQYSVWFYRVPLLLIDGLEECESENRGSQRQILQAFDKVFARTPSCPFRLLVASRNEPQIRAAFDNISSQILPLRLDNQFSPDNNIRDFLNDEFKRVRKTHPLARTLDASWPSVQDIEYIVKKSSGQFIYAATVMRFVLNSSASPKLNLKRVQGAATISTESPFAELDALYRYILSQAEDQEVSHPPGYTSSTQFQSPNMWSQNHTDGQWKPTHQNEHNPATSAFANTQGAQVSRETERVDLVARYMQPPEQHGHESPSSVRMFINAQIDEIVGGTFHYDMHILKYDSPALGGGPAFPITVLGLQALSFTMRPHYPHYNYPLAPTAVIRSPSTLWHIGLQFPSLYSEMIAIGPPTLFIFINMWIHLWAIRHHRHH
ncbi:hypothetical protein D9619_012464 [Psilocybe cf. subviscida]|uniref:NACHT domain-containing protein n=1 Tax=Psilocybe cf. subviscida TaxID=2480587 RepID=A0A8H5ARD5_9AGAR|nr:hypothetical protein D9619_012464 [Psilocybe cf. subviscida]